LGLLRPGQEGLKIADKERGQQRADMAVALRGILFNAVCTEGKFREGESRIIKNLFLLRKLSADDIMTPRTVMSTLPASMTVGEAIKVSEMKFSRIPIFQDDDADHIVGFVLKADIYLEASRGNLDKPLISL
jgi:CBS domain containing-hemolysin-like protein